MSARLTVKVITWQISSRRDAYRFLGPDGTWSKEFSTRLSCLKMAAWVYGGENVIFQYNRQLADF